ncbi:unnamed protein product [Ostreobium quekettii]|uniref:Secreted protein n=1 Tax=Ostreobium quekettii TaxID=121088 RepID=A0A8S1ILF1_9CHLO|nr:unnamed protein product [Ostreobium quekettii]
MLLLLFSLSSACSMSKHTFRHHPVCTMGTTVVAMGVCLAWTAIHTLDKCRCGFGLNRRSPDVATPSFGSPVQQHLTSALNRQEFTCIPCWSERCRVIHANTAAGRQYRKQQTNAQVTTPAARQTAAHPRKYRQFWPFRLSGWRSTTQCCLKR